MPLAGSKLRYRPAIRRFDDGDDAARLGLCSSETAIIRARREMGRQYPVYTRNSTPSNGHCHRRLTTQPATDVERWQIRRQSALQDWSAEGTTSLRAGTDRPVTSDNSISSSVLAVRSCAARTSHTHAQRTDEATPYNDESDGGTARHKAANVVTITTSHVMTARLQAGVPFHSIRYKACEP
jgi:hypothetical protein